MSMAKNTLAVLLGTVACIALFGAVEFLLRIFNVAEHPDASFVMTAGYMVRDKELGFGFAPNTTTTVDKIQGATVVYSATYSSDQFGRRITPRHSEIAPEHFVIFFGDSMSFGEGLQADETLPSIFAERAKDAMPYNYAFHGYGPQQMYAQIMAANFVDAISEQSGIAIYGYFDYHINRVVGSTEVLRWNPGYHPYFYLRNDSLVRDGDFLTGRSTLTALYTQLNKFRVFRALRVELPVIMASHRKLLCEIIHQSQLEFEKKFHGSRFVVALYPLSSKKDDIVQTCFEPHGIPYVDLRDAFGAYGDIGLKNNPYRLGDGHYNKTGASLVADSLSTRLVQQKFQGQF